MVTRYSLHDSFGYDEDPDGKWVRYEDYAALEQAVQDQAAVIKSVVEGVEDGSIVWNKPKEK